MSIKFHSTYLWFWKVSGHQTEGENTLRQEHAWHEKEQGVGVPVTDAEGNSLGLGSTEGLAMQGCDKVPLS